MQAESSISRQASESGGAESEPSTLTQEDTSTSAGHEASDRPRAEQVGVTLPLWGHTGQHTTCLQPAHYLHNTPSSSLERNGGECALEQDAELL